MPASIETALQRIVSDLKFSSAQVDFVARILSLEGETPLVHHTVIDYYDAYLSGGPFLYLNKPRKIHLGVALQKSFQKTDHHQLENLLKEALKTVGIDTNDLFSYCIHSYGINQEKEGIEAHFGFGYKYK